MIKVENICFPRTGYRLLQNLLRGYMGNKLKTGTIYGKDFKSLDDDVNYLKNHDFNLKTPVRDDIGYLVQIRYPVESIVSFYKLEVKAYNREDSLDSWRRFALSKMDYFNKFYKKWVLSDIENRYVCDYTDLVFNTYDEIHNILMFFEESLIDLGRIHKVVKENDVSYKNHIEDFKYYDKGFFEELNKKIENG